MKFITNIQYKYLGSEFTLYVCEDKGKYIVKIYSQLYQSLFKEYFILQYEEMEEVYNYIQEKMNKEKKLDENNINFLRINKLL